jgi:hypothetical protein
MSTSSIVNTGLILSLAAAGCATAAPPHDLINARACYARAEQSPAARLDPADLRTAHDALQAAEQSFVEDGASEKTRDLAYRAGRRAEISEVRANAARSTHTRQQAVEQMHSDEATQMNATSAQLSAANP